MSTWNWLVAQGLVRDFIAAVVGAAVAHLSAWRPWMAHKKRQQQIIAGQAKIADLLDTSKPGGLTDVIERRTESDK